MNEIRKVSNVGLREHPKPITEVINKINETSLLTRYREENERLHECIKELALRLNGMEEAMQQHCISKQEEHKAQANYREKVSEYEWEDINTSELSSVVTTAEPIALTKVMTSERDVNNMINNSLSPEQHSLLNYSTKKKGYQNSTESHREYTSELEKDNDEREIVQLVMKSLSTSEYLVKVFNAISHCLSAHHDNVKCQTNLMNCIQRCLRAIKRGQSYLLKESDINKNTFNAFINKGNNNNNISSRNNIDNSGITNVVVVDSQKTTETNNCYDNHDGLDYKLQSLLSLIHELDIELSYCQEMAKSIATELLHHIRKAINNNTYQNNNQELNTWKNIITVIMHEPILPETTELLNNDQKKCEESVMEINRSKEMEINDKEDVTQNCVKFDTVNTNKAVIAPHISNSDCNLQEVIN